MLPFACRLRARPPQCPNTEAGRLATPTLSEAGMAEEVYIGPGEEWLVLTCHNPACRATLLIEPVRPDMLDEDGAVTNPAETLQATCPHCGFESVYHSDEIRRETGQQRH